MTRRASRFSAALLGVGLFMLTLNVQGQPRDTGGGVEDLRIKLRQSTRFGDTLIPAGTLMVSLKDDTVAFARPDTMVVVGTVRVRPRAVPEYRSLATVSVNESADKVVIEFRFRRMVYRLDGRPEARAASSSAVVARKNERRQTAGLPKDESDVDKIRRGLKRFRGSVEHCGRNAQRSRWKTDDRRFKRCVCPIIERWRLGRINVPVRVSYPVLEYQSGMSFDLSARGRVSGCRVWVGARPPKGEPPLIVDLKKRGR